MTIFSDNRKRRNNWTYWLGKRSRLRYSHAGLIAVLLSSCAALIAASLIYFNQSTIAAATNLGGKPPLAAKTSVAPTVLRPQEPSLIETEIVRVGEAGLDPTSITRPPGRFFLYIQKFSSAEFTNLQLVRQMEQQPSVLLTQIEITLDSRKWAALYDLEPGSYALSDTAHPEWVCNLTITSKQ